MIVANVFREQMLEMPFTHRDNLIKQITLATFDPTLRHAVLPWTSKGGPHGVHLQGSDGSRDVQPILRIPIRDQEAGFRFKRKRLPQQLDNPLARRMAGDVEVQNAATAMDDDKDQQSTRKVTVGTVKKSIAAMASR